MHLAPLLEVFQKSLTAARIKDGHSSELNHYFVGSEDQKKSGLDIYQNAYATRIRESLQEDFETYFRALTLSHPQGPLSSITHFLSSCPSTSWTLAEASLDFLNYLKSTEKNQDRYDLAVSDWVRILAKTQPAESRPPTPNPSDLIASNPNHIFLVFNSSRRWGRIQNGWVCGIRSPLDSPTPTETLVMNSIEYKILIDAPNRCSISEFMDRIPADYCQNISELISTWTKIGFILGSEIVTPSPNPKEASWKR